MTDGGAPSKKPGRRCLQALMLLYNNVAELRQDCDLNHLTMGLSRSVPRQNVKSAKSVKRPAPHDFSATERIAPAPAAVFFRSFRSMTSSQASTVLALSLRWSASLL